MSEELKIEQQGGSFFATVRLREKGAGLLLLTLLTGGIGSGAATATTKATTAKVEANTTAITAVTNEIKTLQEEQKATTEKLSRLERSLGRVEGMLEVILREVKK